MRTSVMAVAANGNLLPRDLKIVFFPAVNHTDVHVSVLNDKSSFLINLPAKIHQWDKLSEKFDGEGADQKNEYLGEVKELLTMLLLKMKTNDGYPAQELVTLFKKRHPEYLTEHLPKNQYAAMRLKLEVQLKKHKNKFVGVTEAQKTLHNQKLIDLEKQIKVLKDKIKATNQQMPVANRKGATAKSFLLGKVSVRFALLKSRTNRHNLAPLECRLRVNGMEAPRFSTGIQISPSVWDAQFQSVRGNEEITARLASIRDGIIQTYNEMRAGGKITTPQNVLDHYFNRGEFRFAGTMTLEELFDVYLAGEKKRTTKADHYRKARACRYYQEFSKQTFVQEVRPINLRNFHAWLCGIRGYKLNYATKLVQYLHAPFQLAIENDAIKQNPATGLKLEKDNNVDITCLSPQELNALKTMEFSEVHQRVVDMFLFMCYTGLHIGDYLALKSESIVSKDKLKWIEIRRQKTDNVASIPLHPIASGLIRKYGSVANLPRITAQRANDHLKVIAMHIGTQKNLTNKIARKTFADMCINERGMSFEAVAAMLGHTSTQFVKIYGRVRHQRIINEWKA